MLTSRQSKMLSDLLSNANQFIQAKYFQDKYGVSVRTVRSDIKRLKEYSETDKGYVIKSVTSRGTMLEVTDHAKLQQLNKMDSDAQPFGSVDNPNERAKLIISELFAQKSGISSVHLASRLYVAKSTLQNDLQHVRAILAQYDIELVSQRGAGLRIIGSEVNIRRCIRTENIQSGRWFNDVPIDTPEKISKNLDLIGHVVVEVLNERKFRISNVALQNLIVHLNIMVARITDGFVVQDTYPVKLIQDMSGEMVIADNIYSRIAKKFGFRKHDSEVKRLAVYLKGKADYYDDSYITDEVDSFVLGGLNQIDEKFGVAFAGNMQLRIALALHIIPLKIRLEYNMQLQNPLLESIQKSYQVAFDMASVFAYALQDKYDYRVSEGEIAYFALYFNHALETNQESKGAQSVLVISSLKRSENLLLQERLRYLSQSEQFRLDIVPDMEVDFDKLDTYDVVCATENNRFVTSGLALPISNFPTRSDVKHIIMAIDGYSSKSSVLKLFDEDLIFVEDAVDKNTVIRQLTSAIVARDSSIQVDLFHEVMLREKMGGTYFGNGIAMPHTIHPVLKETKIAVAILNDSIEWDDGNNHAQIIIMVGLEKNNPKAFRLWRYLSAFTNSPEAVRKIIAHPGHSNFKACLSWALDNSDLNLPEA
jgi:lichenan operon transcriptional antiterminator